MKPFEHFKFCPRCGQPRTGAPVIPFRCTACDFLFYFNPTVAAAAIISRPDGRVLFITRAKEPARGSLAFPGGFIDIGERAEDGLQREIREEVGLQIGDPEFLCSCQNDYPYQGVDYPVLDLLFAAPLQGGDVVKTMDEVEQTDWLEPGSVEPERLAFPSLRAGLKEYLRRRG